MHGGPRNTQLYIHIGCLLGILVAFALGALVRHFVQWTDEARARTAPAAAAGMSLPPSPYLVAGLPDPQFEPRKRIVQPPDPAGAVLLTRWLYPFVMLGIVLAGMGICHVLVLLTHRAFQLYDHIHQALTVPGFSFVDDNGEVVWVLTPREAKGAALKQSS